MNLALKQELNNLPSRYQLLRIIKYQNNIWHLEGKCELNASYEGKIIKETIVLHIEIPDSFPRKSPKIKEIGKKLKSFPHINPDGYFCLGTPEIMGYMLKRYKTVSSFLDNTLIPFLYCGFYFLKHNSLPFPCASHGELERLEEYCLLFNVDDPNIAQEFFKLANNIVNCNFLKPCPCGSLKMLKDCHGEKLKEVKSYLLSNKE